MSKRVLVAPLDWGLGHATRCIPIIAELQKQGAFVILATNGRAYELLKQAFPNLPLEKLPAYAIHYGSSNMFWNIGWQLPKIIWTIWQEHQHLKKLIQKHQLDIVIADNRYGCYNRKTKSIFVSHQINIKIPNLFLQTIVRFCNRMLIQRFDACWIPDLQGENNLAGALSQPPRLAHAVYIGILTRMQYLNLPKKWDVIAVLSGPEPQRTILEEIIIKQLLQLTYKILLVQGKPEKVIGRKGDRVMESIQVVPFLNAKDLNEAMSASDVVICRSGYSTVMDLAVLGKKAILIPTPGQTEQEYLAERFFEKGIFYTQKQAELNLPMALEKVHAFTGLAPQHYEYAQEKLHSVIKKILNTKY